MRNILTSIRNPNHHIKAAKIEAYLIQRVSSSTGILLVVTILKLHRTMQKMNRGTSIAAQTGILF
jgi:hypothetical protein